MLMRTILFLGVVGILAGGCTAGVRQAPPEKGVYFITPQNGDEVTNPFTVRLGLRGMGISPAGVKRPNAGHHHLLIDVENVPALDQPIPKNESHLHYGGGETETTLELSPGVHTLQLLLGDHLHIPGQSPVISERITIFVKDPLFAQKKGVYFITPLNGETVTSPVTVRFGMKGFGVVPAGVKRRNAGHHHLIIDVESPSLTEPIPKNNAHLHFGAGQTETTLELSPGEHTLQLLLGDHVHVPYQDPNMSAKITIFVQ